MKLKGVMILMVVFGLFGFSYVNSDMIAYQQISDLKKGTLLVRLHKNESVINKLKGFHKDKEAKQKTEEVKAQNLAYYKALALGYKFSKIVFFYSEHSEGLKKGSYQNVFLNPSLEIDTSISIDESQPIFILDVGDIYFEHMSGHQEGYVILTNQFEQLEKPFPFYVRKRSGLAIIKRSELDMAILLDEKLTKFYDESLVAETKRAD